MRLYATVSSRHVNLKIGVNSFPFHIGGKQQQQHLPMGGGGFFIVESLFATLFSMWWQFCNVFLRIGRLFFHNLKAFFAPFFHVEAFLLRLSPYGGLFPPLKSLSATFSSMWGPLYYVFLLMGGLFSLFEGPFARFFSFWGTFFTV